MSRQRDNTFGSPQIDKDVQELLLTLYNQHGNETLKDYLEKRDALAVFRMLQQLNKQLTLVKLENLVLTDFLQKNKPRYLITLDHFRIRRIEIRRSNMERRKSRTDSGRTQSRATSIAGSAMSSLKKASKDYRLNYRTKIEMAEKLAAEIHKNCEAIEAKGANEVKTLNAEIEAVRYQCADTNETIRNFEMQFLSNDALINATQKQKRKHFRKFMNNWLKNGSAMLGRMRLEINSIQERCHQLRNELITTTDICGMLGPVDFEQLEIKRDEQIRSLEEKNISLAGLKEVSGKASLALAREKKDLLALEQTSIVLTEKIAKGAKEMPKLENVTRVLEKEVEVAEEELKNIEIQEEEFEAPSITNYMLKKQELIALKKEEKRLQRKNHIKSIKLKNLTLKLRAQKKIDK